MASDERVSLVVDPSITSTFPKVDAPSYSWAGEPEGPDAPPKTGTITSSAMNLAACALGASMLSLPYAMMLSGPVISFSLLLFFAVAAYFAAQSITNAGLKCAKSSYSEIVEFYMGKSHAVFCDTLLSCALAVAAISYIVGLRDLMPNLASVFSSIPAPLRVIGVLTVLFPVTLISNLSAFGSASTFAAFGCYIQAAALVLQALFGSAEEPAGPALASKLSNIDIMGIIYSLPMVCFVYAFHYVLTDTLSEVENPTPERLSAVSKTTIYILVGCYIPVSISGYLMVTGRCSKSNLLECLPQSSPAVFIANWSIGLLLFITYSLFIIPLRRKLEVVVFKEATSQYLDPNRITIAAALAATIGFISIILKDLGLANTLAGGCIALVMFFYPGALLYTREHDIPVFERNRFHVATGMFFMALGLLICFSGFLGNILFAEETLGEIPYIIKGAQATPGV